MKTFQQGPQAFILGIEQNHLEERCFFSKKWSLQTSSKKSSHFEQEELELWRKLTGDVAKTAFYEFGGQIEEK